MKQLKVLALISALLALLAAAGCSASGGAQDEERGGRIDPYNDR